MAPAPASSTSVASRRRRATPWRRAAVLALSASALLWGAAPGAFAGLGRLPASGHSHSARPGGVARRAAAEPEREEARTRPGFAAAALAAALAAATPQLATPTGEFQFSAPARAEEVQERLNTREGETVSLFERNTKGVVFITSEKLALEAATLSPVEVPAGTGSGWVYDREGHIITNYHVIQGASALNVRFIDGTEVPAKVVGADPGSDVAVLQVDGKQLDPLTKGVSSTLKVGQEVFAIGNPFGLDHTLTKGIVSGVGRTIMSVGGRPIQGAIQTDASINPGNSGGPLLNSNGKVVGMNTVIISPSGASAGVGFAIPVDTVNARAQSILKYGYVKRPSLGLYLAQDSMSPTTSRGKDGQVGVLVAGLQRSSSAASKIKAGDIVVKIEDRLTKRINDVYAELDEHEPGDKIRVTLLRPVRPLDEERVEFGRLDIDVVLGEAPTEF